MLKLQSLIHMIEKEPNNMKLGKLIREYYWNSKDNNKIEQFNRNRAIEDQVSTIEEMEEKVKELFSETKYVYEKNPDTGQVYRRELDNYDTKIPVDCNLNPLPLQLNLFNV